MSVLREVHRKVTCRRRIIHISLYRGGGGGGGRGGQRVAIYHRRGDGRCRVELLAT